MKKLIAPVALALLAALCGFALWRYFGAARGAGQGAPAAEIDIDSPASIAAAQAANSVELASSTGAAATQAAADLSQTYTDPDYGFSFSYPNGLVAGASAEGGATTILLQSAASHIGFQVTVTPYSGSATTLTPDVVSAANPGIDLRDALPVLIGGTPGIVFSANDGNFGESRQIWFIKGGYLYQASTYLSQKDLLERSIATWRWAKP